MRERIKQLEKQALALEPDDRARALLLDKVVRYTNTFLENITRMPAYRRTDDEGMGLYDSPVSEEPIDMDTALHRR